TFRLILFIRSSREKGSKTRLHCLHCSPPLHFSPQYVPRLLRQSERSPRDQEFVHNPLCRIWNASSPQIGQQEENSHSCTGIGAIPLESAPLPDLHVRNPFNEAGATRKRERAS